MSGSNISDWDVIMVTVLYNLFLLLMVGLYASDVQATINANQNQTSPQNLTFCSDSNCSSGVEVPTVGINYLKALKITLIDEIPIGISLFFGVFVNLIIVIVGYRLIRSGGG